MTIPLFTVTPNSQTGRDTFASDMDTWIGEINAWAAAANALAAAMTAVAAGGAVSLKYIFDSTTTDADPGAGKLRLSSATQNASTVIRADLLGSETSDYSGLLALLDDSTSTNKGYLMLRHETDATKWLEFSVTSLASPSGYKNITVAPAASSAASPFTNGDAILLDFTPTGDKGDTGTAGTYYTIPQNSKSANYTTVLGDAGQHILHPSTDANARTFTIDSNANVAYAVGTAITFINMTSQVVTIAITADTMYLAGPGTTGSRSLAQYGMATAIKIDSTHWIISGAGLT